MSFTKNGPGHNALARHEAWSQPAGDWQYRNPVALLVNDVTGSASDLFTCELRSAGRVVLVGSTTHGNLSGVATFAVLPCGLVVRISNGYVTDNKGRPVEVTGNVPTVPVEPTIQDFLNHRDPVLAKAVTVLQERVGTKVK
jgi:C-terminal processing protease CtpA/Prc